MTPQDTFDLERFVTAQSGGTHERVIAELRSGHKRTHWMWFVFPQMRGLGHSTMARHYGIAGLDEARAYLAHPVLGPRLQQCAAVLDELAGPSALDIFGPVDAMKLRSSLTLFAQAAGPGSIFERLLGKYFAGERDDFSVAMLQLQART
ncbi:MAG TPA: DUF1810 domain-containing protein [Steroidobacteraceae bacterium]|nr:DUF1810 domain-containing protein [Steroidobacteraceae bacterium]